MTTKQIAIQTIEQFPDDEMIRPIDVAHVNLNVTDLDRAIRFYTQILGFKIAFQYEDAVAWLNFGQYRDDVGGLGQGFHDIALYKVPNSAPEERRKRAGMNHMALRLRTPGEVERAAEYLQSKGVKVLKGPQTHKEDRDRYLYFEDPDGNMIELGCLDGGGLAGEVSSLSRRVADLHGRCAVKMPGRVGLKAKACQALTYFPELGVPRLKQVLNGSCSPQSFMDSSNEITARPLSLEFDGPIYHVTLRGNGGEGAPISGTQN